MATGGLELEKNVELLFNMYKDLVWYRDLTLKIWSNGKFYVTYTLPQKEIIFLKVYFFFKKEPNVMLRKSKLLNP